MKRILPLFFALLLLLAACGTAPAAEPTPDLLAPVAEDSLPDVPSPTPHEGPDEDELPILGADEPIAGDDGSVELPALSDETVTLDGLSSYLRVTLPEGWTWEQAGGTEKDTVYGLYPVDEPAFKVELHWWSDGFPGMCGTGVTISDYALPDGQKATLAHEVSGGEIWWTMILPESPDSFTIQFGVPYELYEAHRAELEEMLSTIRQGVLAGPDGLDVVQTEGATG